MIGKHPPVITQQKIDEFLHGFNPLEYVRSVQVSSYSTEALVFRRPVETKRVFVEKYAFTPFIWVKDFPNEVLDIFFRWKTINVAKEQVEGNYVFIDGNPLLIDNKKVIDLGDNKFDANYRIFSFYLESEAERTAHYESKKAEYEIDDPVELINQYEGQVLAERMDNSFKYLFKIKKPSKPKVSSNPLFAYNKEGKERKINGSYINLLDFFKEGGLDPNRSSGVYLREGLFLGEFKKLKKSEQILLFMNIAYHLKVCDIYFFEEKSINKPALLDYLSNNEKLLESIVANSKSFVQECQTKYDSEFNEQILKEFLEDKLAKLVSKKNKLKEKDIYDYLLAIEDKVEFLREVYNKGLIDSFFNIEVNEDAFKVALDFDLEAKSRSREFLEFLENNNLLHITEEFLSLFYTLGVTEQFMIQSGIRLFKGYEEYSDLFAFVFDIETKALPQYSHVGTAALSPQMGYIFKIGIYTTKGLEIILEANSVEEEKEMLERFFEILGEENPDLLLTYNGEHFDFRFIEGRMAYHKMVAEDKNGDKTVYNWIREKIKNLIIDTDDVYVSDWAAYNVSDITLKVGGTIEDTKQTSIVGINSCDTYFAVKRAAAIDSKIENLKLKYNIKYAKVEKPNRVYIDGDKIGEIENATDIFMLNDQDGHWFKLHKNFSFVDEYNKKDLKIDENGEVFFKNIETLYFANINLHSQLKKAYNILFFDPTNSDAAYVNSIKSEFYVKLEKYNKYIAPKDIFNEVSGEHLKVWRNIFTEFKEALTNDEKLLSYIDTSKYKKVDGKHIVSRYLEDDLWETYKLDEIYSQASFLLAKWAPTTYQKVTTMGTASVWKLILTAWSYENGLAIPSYERGRKYPGALVGMTSSGYHKNVVKLDYAGLYPALFLAHVPTPDFDISGVMHPLVRYGVEGRLHFKDLKKKSEKAGDYKTAMFYDKKQLPLKIMNNSFYGMLGAAKVSPFSNIDSAHHITALGRQHIRQLIKFAEDKYNIKSIYFHTDGVNVVLNDDTSQIKYIGKGLNWTVTEGKEYIGIEAVVAEFNDTFLRDKMAIGIDEYVVSCINFAKGNFIYLKEKLKDGEKYLVLDHTGGAVIKKGQSEFIVDFIEENTKQLLLGNGQHFINKYYEYINKIRSKEIIAKKIASKARVTKTMEDYDANSKVKQAHMELLRQANIKPDVGDWIYYINTGNKASDSDYTINKEKIGTCDNQEALLPFLNKEILNEQLKQYLESINFKFRKKKGIEDLFNHFFEDYDQVTFLIKKEGKSFSLYKQKEMTNCILITEDNLYSRVDYNVERYLHQFKSAVSPLMVAFPPNIREKIANEDIIASFEVELCSGIPLAKEQDNMEELMKITEEEYYIWDKLGVNPIFV